MSEFAGSITENTEGEELAQVVTDHWHVGSGAMLFLEEVVYAHEVTGLSLDDVKAFADAVNQYRHHDYDVDTLAHAFVPQERIADVCALLDQIQSLCVKF